MQRPMSSASRSRIGAAVSAITDAFAYPLRTSHYLELVNPLWTTHALQARVVGVWDETAEARTLTLKPGRNWRSHRPGQHLRVGVPIGGMHYTRTYSISSAPDCGVGDTPETFTITVKAIAGGRMSHHLVRNIKVGDYLPIGVPQGDFYLPDANPVEPLFITAGSGITPVMSMLRTLCEEGHKGQITFLHYSNAASDQIYADELAMINAQHLNVELLRCYNDGQGGELQGLFSREQLLKAVPDFADAQAFLCGPPGMMKAVQKVWADEGLSAQLHLEHFTAAATAVVIDAANAEGEVRFARSERQAKNNGATLLDQAEAAGLKPESGCRMGICKACTCIKTAGKVRDTRTGEISDGGEAEIQICVSVPVGTVTLDI